MCSTDVSLSAAATEWKESSSEEKVARLLAEGAVVVNSLRRYLKLSSLPPAASWPFCILSWTAALCSGARLQGPRWIMAHFFHSALGERERLPSQLIWLLAILATTTSRPDEGFIRLYIDTHTHSVPLTSAGGFVLSPPPPPARPCKSSKTLQIYGGGESVSCCGVAVTQRRTHLRYVGVTGPL